jgi:GntR family transcriptional regulator
MSESLYRTYQSRLGLWIARAEDRIHLAPFPQWTPGTLAPAGQIAGLVDRRAWSETGVAVEVSRTWFNTARARYVQRLR